MPISRSGYVQVPRSVSVRWTLALAESFTPVSDFFLDHYSRLSPSLKSTEAMFVIQLMRYKWDETAPFPAFKTIAGKMGISASAARVLARSLEEKGYLERQMQVGQTNRFHLNKLFVALEKLKLSLEKQAIERRYSSTGPSQDYNQVASSTDIIPQTPPDTSAAPPGTTVHKAS